MSPTKNTPKNTLCIIFQRETSNSNRDDVLKVVPTGDGWVSVNYYDKNSNIQNKSFMRETGFMNYMESLFTLMKFDDSPYPYVQISAPCHPQILIPHNALGNEECIQTLGNVLSSCWRIWYPISSNTSDIVLEDIEEEPHQYNGCYCDQGC
jgi:hypothetical protein